MVSNLEKYVDIYPRQTTRLEYKFGLESFISLSKWINISNKVGYPYQNKFQYVFSTKAVFYFISEKL